jgi:hypothetical protein
MVGSLLNNPHLIDHRIFCKELLTYFTIKSSYKIKIFRLFNLTKKQSYIHGKLYDDVTIKKALHNRSTFNILEIIK